jgi:hypothetical protein
MIKELIINDKQKYLDENYPFEGAPELTDRFECIHCSSIFKNAAYEI